MIKIALELDVNNVIVGYAVCLNDTHEPIINGVKIDTDIDLMEVEIVNNYKFDDGRLIELAEGEKPKVILQISDKERIDQLENMILMIMELM